ncbi:helix-turn-helix transcriptional regulator, partial [Pseudomonas aeruginosa]
QLAVLGLVRPWVAGLMRQRLAFEDEVLNSPAAPEPGWQGSLEKVAEQMGTPLTARELEVGRLMLSGCSSKEIARKLAISAETVKVHRKHMYGKLGIKSQSELFGLFLQAQG